jgi:DNA mismatch endonuclease, patch repair protein
MRGIPLYSYEGALIQYVEPQRLAALERHGLIARTVIGRSTRKPVRAYPSAPAWSARHGPHRIRCAVVSHRSWPEAGVAMFTGICTESTRTTDRMDRLTPERRSRLMALVKAKDTTPELAVRRMIHSLGFRYRLHREELPGTPDLVFPKRRCVIFVNGCFWHQHQGCARSKRPSAHAEYWANKLDGNINRDARNISDLERSGWRVLTIWECELRDAERLSRMVNRFLSARRTMP